MTAFFASAEPVQEKEEFTKPGTANVSADDRKKLSGLLKHYRAQAHPFGACKKDQIKHGLSEDHANRRCAVIKDLIEGGTGWRKGGKSKATEDVAVAIVAEALQIVQLAATALGGRGASELIREGNLRESERGRVAVAGGSLEEVDAQTDLAISELALAAGVLEAAPRWMLPVAARRPGFKPLNPEKRSTSTRTGIRRAPKGTAGGGRFITTGSSGREVSAIQRRLGITETGTYGGRTKKRVERFQENHGLQVDGVIGAQTAAALRGVNGAKSVTPGALTKHDRRYFRRYTGRTAASPGGVTRLPKAGSGVPAGGGSSGGGSSSPRAGYGSRRIVRRAGGTGRGGVVV